MSTKTIGNYTYSFGKLAPRVQFHVVRRIMPAMTNVIGVLQGLQAMGRADVPKEEILATCSPAIIESMGRMADEDLDYVLDHCLSVVQRQQEQGGWAPIMAPNHAMMFADITMPQMVQLAYAALEENVGNFFDLLPSA